METSRVVRKVAIAIAACGAATVLAHPNHADPNTHTTLVHLLTEPDHVLLLLGSIGAVIAAVRLLGRRDQGDSASRRRKE